MSMQDQIGDMLTRIRNSGMAGIPQVSMPSSKMKSAVAAALKDEGYISDFSESAEGAKKTLTVVLKYHDQAHVIEGIKRISRPSCRIYCSNDEIPRIRNGLGTVILSTSEGVMSGARAKRKKLGGEILCSVW